METSLSELYINPPEYKREDFTDTTAPYDFVFSYNDTPFLHNIALEKVSEKAKSVKFGGFKGIYNKYKALKIKEAGALKLAVMGENYTEFSNQPIELNCGMWECDDLGVHMLISDGNKLTICPHPIVISERLVNIDTGNHKISLSFYRGKRWNSIVVDKSVISSASKITELSSRGVAVTSETAKYLVKFLADIEAYNYDRIPERQSVSRLGYIFDEGFAPYIENLIYDGDNSFKMLYSAVSQRGSYDKWLEIARGCRDYSVVAKIMLAASFASVLIKPLDALPFFVHLWGVASGTGKTVGLMLAASVWGNPARGQYVQTFNATEVGQERMAAFFNDLPMMIDELQLARDRRGNIAFNVYSLAQGTGRTRGNKTGGVDTTPTWNNCILTTGESPLASYTDGAGAVNRVIEIECKQGNKVIADGVKTAPDLGKNYGHAGKMFVSYIERCKSTKDDETNGFLFDILIQKYRDSINEIQELEITEKQAMAAAIILLADSIITEFFFKENPLTIDEIAPYLKTQKAVSLGERGYNYICEWIAVNTSRFIDSAENKGELYGVIETDDKSGREYAYIIKNRFDKALDNEGISSQSVLSWLKEKGLIRRTPPNNTFSKRIGGAVINCVALQLPSENLVENEQWEVIL